MRYIHALLCILFVAVIWSKTAHATMLRKLVFVSILPQKSFVQQISGDLIDVEVMVQPGANPVTYEPKPSQMRNLAASQAYFCIGVPFEDVWLDKITAVNSTMRIIHTDRNIEKIAMAAHVHGDSDHGDGPPQNDKGLDPHTWLSPLLVKKQAQEIHASLVEIYPEHARLFTDNFRRFMDRIDALHGRLQNQLRDYRGREFMVFHPSWGYFAREYGLEQVAIEIEGKNPKPAQVQKLIEYAGKHNIRVIFAQKQFSQKSARIIAREIGGKVVDVDPLAEDWFANMEEVGLKFKEAIE